MPKFISGRYKKTPQTGLTSDRYRYLSPGDAEPDLGDPITGPSAYLTKLPPAGNQYIVIGVEGYPGERYWIPNQGGLIPGSISIFDEGVLIGGLSSTTQLDFLGNSVIAEGLGGINPGFAVTITIAPPGNDTEVLFKTSSGTPHGDFATDSRFTFDNGLLATGDRITVGTGGTVITTLGDGLVGIGITNPTQELHLNGDFRITGTIYDSLNQPGDQGDLIVKGANGGLIWARPNSVVSGAGGTIGQIQFHNTAGLVDGADNFYFDFNNNRVGIGSTIPSQLLDVLGVSTFRGGVTIDNLTVTNNTILKKLDVDGLTTLDDVSVSSVATFNGNIDANGNLDVDGTTDLDVLNVSDTANFTNTTDNTLGNTNTGAVQIDGGVGIDKNLTVGQTIRANNLNITGVGTIQELDLNTGDFENITVSGFSTLGNVVVGVNSISTKPGTGNLIIDSDGSSSIIVNDFLIIQKNTESTGTNSGALQVDGGIGVDKSVNIGLNLNVTGDGSGQDVILASAGGITTTGGDLYIGENLFIKDDLVLDSLRARTGTFTESLDVQGITTTDTLRVGTNPTLSIDAILDEDDFISNSAAALATQQSIKAYVDTQITSQDLDFAGDTGSGSVDLDSQTFTIAGTANEIETSGSNQTLTIGLPDNVTVSGNLTVNGNTTLGNNNNDNVVFNADVDSNIIPDDDNIYDLGSSNKKWNNIYANTFIGSVTGVAEKADTIKTQSRSNNSTHYLTFVNSNNSPADYESLYTDAGIIYNPSTNSLTVSGNLNVNGNTTLGDSNNDNVVFNADVDSNIIPDNNNTYDLGSSNKRWRNLYANNIIGELSGTASDLLGGAAGSIPYQNATDSTTFLAEPNANDKILSYDNATNSPIWIDASSIETTQAGAASSVVNSTANDVFEIDNGELKSVDPGGDRLVFFDDSANKLTFLELGDRLTIDGSGNNTTINAVESTTYQLKCTQDSAGTNSSDNNNPYLFLDASIGSDDFVQISGSGGISVTRNNNGKLTIDGINAGSGQFFTGMIIMFSGTSIPSGWALCNGANGTPDLRGRFIVGAQSASKTGTTDQPGPGFNSSNGAIASTYEPGDIGGSTAHQLTEAQLATHDHPIGNHSHSIGNHTHNIGNHSHNIGNHTHGSGNLGGATVANANQGSHSHQVGQALGNDTDQTQEFAVDDDDEGRNVVEAGSGGGVHNHNVSVSGSTGNPNAPNTSDTGNPNTPNSSVTGNVNNPNGNVNTGNSNSNNTDDAGSNRYHENRPPYYALCYIMKT